LKIYPKSLNNNMPYSFNTTLLSAQKTGSPVLIGTLLSAFGVNVISLSTNDKGIAFNAVTPLLSTLTNVTIQGSVFRIDTAYQGASMALVKVPENNVSTYTTYIHNSALTVAPVSAISVGETDVIDVDGRRKWLLGYQ
jgi:hypothetical protein